MYEDDCFIGQVIDYDDEDVHINFLTKCKGRNIQDNTYKWPAARDDIWVPIIKVVCGIEPPTQVSKRQFVISGEQADHIGNMVMIKNA